MKIASFKYILDCERMLTNVHEDMTKVLAMIKKIVKCKVGNKVLPISPPPIFFFLKEVCLSEGMKTNEVFHSHMDWFIELDLKRS